MKIENIWLLLKKLKKKMTNPNTNNSKSYNNASKFNKINKMNKIPQKSNPVNTYIINTLNVSEKDFLNSGIASAKPKESDNKDLKEEINKIIKEKEEMSFSF